MRRVKAFQKSLTDLAELELKSSKAHAQMLRMTIQALKAEMWGLKEQYIFMWSKKLSILLWDNLNIVNIFI